MNRRPPLLLLAVLLPLVALVAGPWQRTEPAGREPLRLGLSLQPTDALALIALDRGFFSAEGLDVAATFYPSGKRALEEGLLAGAVEAAATTDLPVALAGVSGGDFRIVATTFEADDVNRVVARGDRGIATPADLRGKRLGVQAGSSLHYFLYLFLLAHGIPASAVEWRPYPMEGLAAALAAGEVDAVSLREPAAAGARDLAGAGALLFTAPGLHPQSGMIAVAGGLLRDRPEAVVRLLRGLHRAEVLVRERRDEAAALLARRFPVPPQRLAPPPAPCTLRLGLTQSTLLLLESEARWLLARRLAPAGRTMPNFLDYLDAAPLTAVVPAAVSIEE